MLDKLKERGFLEHKATGQSMMPFIRGGDLIIIRSYNGKLQKGDVGLFEKDGKLFLHRVRKVYINGYDFRGDNCYRSDGFVPREKVFGKLEAIYKNTSVMECNSKKFKFLSSLYNFILFRYPNICFMRLFSKIKRSKKKK